MISKSILTAIILLLLYETFTRVSGRHGLDTSQNDKSANLISVQDFIYNYPQRDIAVDTVIVGTSVSRKLITDSLGGHYINLAFNAWSTYDGLQLVKLSRKKPACLLVEMNYVKSQVLQPEITNSLEPISYYSGKMLKSLQLRNQPVGLMVGEIKNSNKARMDELKKKKRDNTELYKLNLRMNIEKMNQLIPDSILDKRFTVLKLLIDGFKKQDIGVVFFEVPFDEELEHTASVLQTRKYFYRYFPPTSFKYVSIPTVNNYVYSDGVHLSLESALDYTLYLKSELNKN